MLSRIPRVTHPNLLVGFETSDDAGVYRLTDDIAIVQTVDFFTPIVDDPFLFGAIAAANSLSDVYAMGGVPVTALSILAYPGKGDLDDLERILAGGAEKMAEADCLVVGGHSVNDEEIKFGYSVTGTISPRRVLANSTAQPGDALLFTKRIGTGVIATALKRGIASDAHVEGAIRSMLALNRAACEAMLRYDVHACTDITGFGLIGHAREMAKGSGVTIVLEPAKVPLLEGALDYARQGAIPGGLKNNREFAACAVENQSRASEELENLLYDPQTSGGLLIALPPDQAAELTQAFPTAIPIGRVEQKGATPIRLT